jgi:hypothetical protein
MYKKERFIKDAETMWAHFTRYIEEAKANPIKVHDFVGKDGHSVYREREKPLTLEGFENWCADQGIIKDLGDYFSNNEGKYTDFIDVCKRIRRRIRQDQIEGGMAGIYNPQITQRLNGLVEKTENVHDVREIIVKEE